MTSQDEKEIPMGIRLKERSGYPDWLAQLRFYCKERGIWDGTDGINPNNPTPGSTNYMLSAPKAPPTALELMIEPVNIAYKLAVHEWEEKGSIPADKPNYNAAIFQNKKRSAKEIRDEYEFSKDDYKLRQSDWIIKRIAYKEIGNWVQRSVDHSILRSLYIELGDNDDVSVQALVRALKDKMAPNDAATRLKITTDYKNILDEARKGHVKPHEWYNRWYSAMRMGEVYHIPEVIGPLAVRDFLTALSEGLAPSWAIGEIKELIKTEMDGLAIRLLDSYGRLFQQTEYEQSVQLKAYPKVPGIFAT